MVEGGRSLTGSPEDQDVCVIRWPDENLGRITFDGLAADRHAATVGYRFDRIQQQCLSLVPGLIRVGGRPGRAAL
jgi:hypothetical protein